jgi:hypothetical protein
MNEWILFLLFISGFCFGWQLGNGHRSRTKKFKSFTFYVHGSLREMKPGTSYFFKPIDPVGKMHDQITLHVTANNHGYRCELTDLINRLRPMYTFIHRWYFTRERIRFDQYNIEVIIIMEGGRK